MQLLSTRQCCKFVSNILMVMVKVLYGSLVFLSTIYSLHLGGKKLLTVGRPVATAVLDCLLEVLSLLRHDYQSRLVLAERANLLRLARDVILFESTIAKTLAVENSRKEPMVTHEKKQVLKYDDQANLTKAWWKPRLELTYPRFYPSPCAFSSSMAAAFAS